jgi:hypothetical protein
MLIYGVLSVGTHTLFWCAVFVSLRQTPIWLFLYKCYHNFLILIPHRILVGALSPFRPPSALLRWQCRCQGWATVDFHCTLVSTLVHRPGLVRFSFADVEGSFLVWRNLSLTFLVYVSWFPYRVHSFNMNATILMRRLMSLSSVIELQKMPSTIGKAKAHQWLIDRWICRGLCQGPVIMICLYVEVEPNGFLIQCFCVLGSGFKLFPFFSSFWRTVLTLILKIWCTLFMFHRGASSRRGAAGEGSSSTSSTSCRGEGSSSCQSVHTVALLGH